MFSITHITEFSYCPENSACWRVCRMLLRGCWRASQDASLTSRPGCADIVAQNIRTARAARACRLSVLSLAVLIFYASWSLSRGSMLGYRRTQSLCKLFSCPGGNILCFCHRFQLSTYLQLPIFHVPDIDMWLFATYFG